MVGDIEEKGSISKDEINIIRSAFGDSGSCCSRFISICLVHNINTYPRKEKRDNITLIQRLVLKNDKIFITKYITSIKAYHDNKMIDPAILKPRP